jgi:20S proteasome subunit beta 2
LMLDETFLYGRRNGLPHHVQIIPDCETWTPSSFKVSNIQQHLVSSWKWDSLKLSIKLPDPPKNDIRNWKRSIPVQSIAPKDAQSSSSVFQKQQQQQGAPLLLRSTGTTIVGLVLADKTVILGADTRATDGRIVADKSCSKIHPLTSHDDDDINTSTTIATTATKDIHNVLQQHLQQSATVETSKLQLPIYACGAGTSGDLDALARFVRYTLRQLHSYQNSIGNHPDSLPQATKAVLVHHVCSLVQQQLYEAQGSLGVNWILGASGGILVAMHPHGSFESLPYAALGSGGPAGLAILEANYDSTLPFLDAVHLVVRAVQAGIDNDLGSGSHVDLCIMHADGRVLYLRVTNDDPIIPIQTPFRIENTDDCHGANGFGNLPYREERRRVLRPPLSEETV